MKKHLVFIASVMPVIIFLAFVLWRGDSVRYGLDILVILLPMALMEAGMFVRKPSRWFYGFALIFPFIWVGVCSVAGIMPLSTIIVFMTLPVAIACAQTMKKIVDGGSHLFSDLGERTARFQIMFSALLTVSFVVARFL